MAVEKIEVVLDDRDDDEGDEAEYEHSELQDRDVDTPQQTSADVSNKFIIGSFRQAYAVDTFLSYVARSSIFALTTPVITMSELSPTLKSIFVAMPLVSNLFAIIPMNLRMNRHGATKETAALFALSSVGMITVTTLAATTDLHTVNAFDWRYALMLGSGLLIGAATGALQLISDAMKWCPKKEYVPDLQLLHSFLVDSSSVTTPIIVFFFGRMGYYNPLSIYTGLSLSSLLLTISMVNPSPYHQYRTQYPHDEARELAIQSGQMADTIKNYDTISSMDILRENLTVLNDRRLILLAFSVFASLGNLFISKTILPNLLVKGFGLGISDAVVTSALANLGSIIVRPITAKMIFKWDNDSGGMLFHLIGCTLTFSGAMALAITPDLPEWALYFSLALAFTGFGIAMTTASSIAVKWSEPVNGSLKKINPGTMFNLIGTIGALGGIILPLLLSLLVDQTGASWYQQYFYIIIGMMVVSAIGIPVVNHQVRRRQDESFFNSNYSFFNSVTNSNEPPIPVAIPGLRDSQAQQLAATEQSPEEGSSSDDEFIVNWII